MLFSWHWYSIVGYQNQCSLMGTVHKIVHHALMTRSLSTGMRGTDSRKKWIECCISDGINNGVWKTDDKK